MSENPTHEQQTKEKYQTILSRLSDVDPNLINEWLDQPDFFPPLVPSIVGIHELSEEKKSRLQQLIKQNLQPESLAESLVASSIARIEAEQQEEINSLEKIDKLKIRARKNIRSEKLEDLSIKAKEIVGLETELDSSRALVKNLLENPRYQQIGSYLKQLDDSGIDILLNINPNQPQPHLLQNIKNLLRIKSEVLPGGKSIESSDLISGDLLNKISVLRSTLERSPGQFSKKGLEKRWKDLSALTNLASSRMFTPEAIINLLLKAETSGWLSEQKEIDPERQSQIENLQAISGELENLLKVSSVLSDIEKEPNLDSSESQFLLCETMESLISRNRISSSWALEIIQGSEILNSQTFQKTIKAILDPREFSNAPSPADSIITSYKILNWLTILTLSSGLIYSYAKDPDLRDKISQDIVSKVQQFSQQIPSLFEQVEEPQIDPDTIVKNTEETDLKIVEEQEEGFIEKFFDQFENLAEGTDPLPKELPEKSFDAPALTSENMKWDNSAGFAEVPDLDPRGEVSAEQFMKQSSEIAWQINLNKGEKPDYLITDLAPVYEYDEKSDSFQGYGININQKTLKAVGSSTETAAIELVAKHQYLSSKLISIPSPWGYHIESAKVEIVDRESGKVEKRFSVQAATGITQEQILVLDFDEGEENISVDENQEIVIKVGLEPGMPSEFSGDFLYADKDAKFPDASIFPPEVLQKIEWLNDHSESTDLQKLQELRNWFIYKFTYSFDLTYSQYYNEAYPDPETFYRRFFGTGNVQDDPSYNEKLARRGVCESVNVAYTLAARQLDLKDGQVMMATGFANNGDNSNSSDILTNGQLHAWSVYVDNQGVLSHLDATPANPDEYSEDVLNSCKNPNISSVTMADTGFQATESMNLTLPETKAPEFVDDLPAFSLKNLEPYPERISTLVEGLNQPIGTWTMNDPYNLFRGLNLVSLPVEISFDMGYYSIDWRRSSSYMRDMGTVSLKQTFEGLNQEEVDIYFPGVDLKHLEEQAPEIKGIVKLEGNAVILPNLGEISPKTIRVNQLIRGEGGKVERVPLPIANLRRRTADAYSQMYILVLDGDPNTLKDSVVEISYKTFTAGYEPRIFHDYWAEDFFKPIVEKDVFDKEFSKFLTDLDKAKTTEEIVNFALQASNGERDLSGQIPSSGEFSSGSIDRIKIWLIVDYLEKNFELTWNPEWHNLYMGSDFDSEEYWRRVTKYKAIDPRIATSLLIVAARTLDSAQGDHKIPLAANISYDFYPGFSFPNVGVPLPNNKNDLREVEKVIYPVFYDGDPTEGIDLGEHEYLPETLDYALGHVLLNTLSRDAGARTALKLYPIENIQSESLKQNYALILENVLSNDERFELTLKEWAELKFLNWQLNYPRRNIDVFLGLTTGILLADWVRRKTDWWKDFSPSRFEQSLEKAAKEIGLKKDNNLLYRDLSSFFDQVLSKKYSPSPIIRSFQKASSTRNFLRGLDKLPVSKKETFYLHPGEAIEDFFASPRESIRRSMQSSYQREKILEMALNTQEQYSVKTMRLARIFSHQVLGQPWLAQVLDNQIRHLSSTTSATIENIIRNNTGVAIPHPNIDNWIFQAIKLRVSDQDPEKFILGLSEHFVGYMRDLAKKSKITLNEKAEEELLFVGETLSREVIFPYRKLLKNEALVLYQTKSKGKK